MMSSVGPLYPRTPEPSGGDLLKAAEPAPDRVVELARKKINQVDDALMGSDPKGTLMVVTDLSNGCYSGLQAATSFAPTIGKVASVAWAGFIGGEVIGTINLVNAFVSLQEGLKECGDSFQKGKLFADFLFQIAVSILMILASMAFRVTALSGFAALVSANPVILALLFLLPLLPTIVDVSVRHRRMDNFPILSIEGEVSKVTIQAAFSNIVNADTKLEEVELNWGDECAKAFMELWKALKENQNEDKLVQLYKALTDEQTRWKAAQKWKLCEVFSMIIASAFGIGALGGDKKIMSGLSSAFTAVGNLVPVYPDATMKLMRNTPYLLEPLKIDEPIEPSIL